MAQVTQTRGSEADLLEIWAFIAENNMEAADKVISEINAKCQACADMPGIGRRREDILPGFRSLVSGDYVIFYQAIEGGVRIMRVLHGSRDLPSQFNGN